MWPIVRCTKDRNMVTCVLKQANQFMKSDASPLARSIGSTIVKLRRIRSISQEQLSLQAGIDRHYMSDIENGKRRLSCEMLAKIAECFSLSLSELISLSENPWKLEPSTQGLNEALIEEDCEGTVILESPDYLSAIIGRTEDGRLIYSYSQMVTYLMLHDGMEYEEACEFIDYNTIRALPYMGDKAPIISYDLPF